ncbi:MAG: chlororespiratory reduction protein 7 [Cyanobacteria bacterium P01_G01_bin.54]
MANSIMYQEDAYVVLDSEQPEQEILEPLELHDKLKALLPTLDRLPPDLQAIDSLDAQVQHLIESYCELDLGPNRYLQWYVVRLEK